MCDVPAALGDLMKFLISDEADTTIVDAACLTDFVQIPCAVATQTSAGGACTNNLCGAAFSAVTGAAVPVPVYSTSRRPNLPSRSNFRFGSWKAKPMLKSPLGQRFP